MQAHCAMTGAGRVAARGARAALPSARASEALRRTAAAPQLSPSSTGALALGWSGEAAAVAVTDGGEGARTLALCFAAALLEGADIVSMGLAAPGVAREFRFTPDQLGYVLTAAVVGLMLGAAAGGALGDRIGRKQTLLAAFALVAAASLGTVATVDLMSLLIVRLGCGLGLGAAFPNLIALAAEAARPGRRSTAVGLMFCGQPVGGATLGLIAALAGAAFPWRAIFYIGGLGPLLLIPLLWVLLPESRAFSAAAAEPTPARTPLGPLLFGRGRRTDTVLLWTSFALTQGVVYVINNWLPTLMVAKGFSRPEAAAISSIENYGAAAGCVLLARWADGGDLRRVFMVTYALMIAGLAAMAVAQGFAPVAAAGVLVGFFAVGGQLVLYAAAPAFYPVLARARGVGAAVGVGRLGAVAGPLATGALLAAGLTATGVLLAATPVAAAAGVAALALAARARPLSDA